jgi:hypothetical protein
MRMYIINEIRSLVVAVVNLGYFRKHFFSCSSLILEIKMRDHSLVFCLLTLVWLAFSFTVVYFNVLT